ncbi:MAG: RNA polymerase sigma factor [Candidatus Omnitrophica bacterium]|nr:RNA polymerase sigma factor [Candidatus Omnitrophota bacterium]MDE2222946.1 RNA polymerase sigma factor [Candidatus Omnitrophota bacterium]
MTDEELINRFYQQDQEALNVLFKRHKDGLFNFAFRLSANRADAEDAVSHTFMMLCQKRYEPQPGASFKTWAYTIARNACLSRLRTKFRFFPLRQTRDDGQEGQVDIADTRNLVHEELRQQETAAIIQKAVSQLPPEQKEALLLREYHDFRYEEIANVLDCSLEKVKVLIFRARVRLKETLPPVLLEEGEVK